MYAHLDLCLAAGINHEGINAEVAKGQWEFQIFGKGSKRAADEVWIARYLLLRLCEKYRVDVNFHPKPLGMDYDWNGSGMHTNFSTEYLREVGGEEYFEALMTAFDGYKDEHIAVYGPDNHMRLTGLHETQAIDKFNYGVANRGASVRVPHSFVKNGYRGYLEDRRPNSLGDPYQIAGTDPADDRDGPDRRSRDPGIGGGLGSTATLPADVHGYWISKVTVTSAVTSCVPGSIGVDEADGVASALNMTGGVSLDCSVIDDTGPTMNEPASPSAVAFAFASARASFSAW